jgi:transposase
MELLMSQRERDRLKVIALLAREGVPKLLTQAQAAEQLGLTERQARRLVAAYRLHGDVAVVNKARGRPSNHRLGDDLREEVLALVQAHYHDFGPTLAAEKLAERHDIFVSRETLRRWMADAGLWKPRHQKACPRLWRERRACLGELVQMDTSEHDWFEGRGEKAVLIHIVDDATGRLYARFFPADTTEANMTILCDYLRLFGRPLALYVDKASHFRVNRAATVEEQLADRPAETQIGRALRELGIEHITAHSAPAKGRVERSFGTAQDRLVKELRLRHISTIEAANCFLEEFWIADRNERSAVAPRSRTNAHRSVRGFDLDAIFSRQETRVVGRDHTVRFENLRFLITRGRRQASLARAVVTVEVRLDGSRRLRYKDRYLDFEVLPPEPPRAAALPLGLRPRSRAAGHRPPPLPPNPDHPWRSFSLR